MREEQYCFLLFGSIEYLNYIYTGLSAIRQTSFIQPIEQWSDVCAIYWNIAIVLWYVSLTKFVFAMLFSIDFISIQEAADREVNWCWGFPYWDYYAQHLSRAHAYTAIFRQIRPTEIQSTDCGREDSSVLIYAHELNCRAIFISYFELLAKRRRLHLPAWTHVNKACSSATSKNANCFPRPF